MKVVYKAFAVIESSDGWYQLIHRPTLQTVSCGGDLDKILGVMKKYIRQFKTGARLEARMKKLLEELPVGVLTQENLKEHIQKSAYRFEELIEYEVDEAMRDVREDGTLRKTMKRKVLVKLEQAIPLPEQETIEIGDFPDLAGMAVTLPKKVRKPVLIGKR